jgi:hypothetical protein
LTSVGHSYSESIQAAKAHLQKVRANAERRKQMKGKDAVMTTMQNKPEAMREEMMREVGNVGNDIDDQFACLCCEGVMEDFPDSFGETDDLAAAAASLDVHDYLQRDADVLLESVFLSLRSDVARNPQSPGYDMAMPPANHREAMMRSDAEEWKKVEDKELEMLRSMGVYVDDELPEGRKAIGN